jgi:hypothetical protein
MRVTTMSKRHYIENILGNRKTFKRGYRNTIRSAAAGDPRAPLVNFELFGSSTFQNLEYK